MIHSYLNMKSKGAVLLILLLMRLALPCLAEKPVIHANRQEYLDGVFTAEGDVEVIYGEYRIYAQYVTYNEKTKEIFARGRVTMVSAESTISGSQLTFNVETRSGEMVDTYGLMKPTIRYSTEKLNQVDDENMTFDKMEFTSCAQRVPRWKITCRKGKIQKEKYVEMKDAVLRVKNIPIFYVPWLKYPIQKDGRATGFLFPRFGNSSLRGFFIQNSFFWEMKSNLDLTLGVDYYAKVGWGANQEFRYLFKNTRGFLSFYYFDYSSDSVFQTDRTHDYYLKGEHVQNLNFLNTKIILKANYPSDPNFLRLFNNNFDQVISTNYDTSFNLSSTFSIFNFSIKASRRETFWIIPGSDEDEDEDDYDSKTQISQTLPSISLNINHKKIGRLPGYFSVRSTYESIQKSGVVLEGEPTYDTGEPSKRIFLVPSYTLDLLTLPWFSSTVTLEAQNTFYARSVDPESGEVLDEPLYIGYQSATAVFKGPLFYNLGESDNHKTKHLIEPELTFRYVTPVPEEDLERILRVDRRDFPSYSYVGFALTSRWLSKSKTKGGSPREIATFTLGQKYYFDPSAANLGRDIDGVFPEFSDLTGRLSVKPIKEFTLTVNAAYNYYIDAFTSLNTTIAYEDPDGPVSGSFSYNVYRNAYVDQEYFVNRTTMRGKLLLDFPRFPFKIDSGADYDLTEKEFRSGWVKVFLDYQCLTINAEFIIRLYLGDPDFVWNVGVSFGNLGVVADFFSPGSEGDKK